MPFRVYKHTSTGEIFVRINERNGRELLCSHPLENEGAARRFQKLVANSFLKEPALVDLILNGLTKTLGLTGEGKKNASLALTRAMDKAVEQSVFLQNKY